MTQRFSKGDLEKMSLVIGEHRDIELSRSERVRLWINRYPVGGGSGSGNGYDCVSCGSNDMHYFKRIHELKGAIWNPESTKHIVVPPIDGAIQLPKEVFYLMGKCKKCNHEQQVSDKPNRITYWSESRVDP